MDSITGFGGSADEINLGLNINSNVSSATNDFSTLDQVLQQIIKDEETFNGIQNDSFEKAKAITQEIRNSGQEGQQLISIFKALRGEQQGSLQDAKQLASTYQQINNELQKAQQNKTRLGITSPGGSVPGSIPPTGGSGPIPGVPATQTAAGGGGGIIPPNTSSAAGFADEPDDFFGREEIKSGANKSSSRRPSDVDFSYMDPSEVDPIDMTPGDVDNFGKTGTGRRKRGSIPNEHYKTPADLALSIFPGQGYYSRLRKARWLARNENGVIKKFTDSFAGKRLGTALNRLGGGQYLRIDGGKDGYQLFPFAQDENGNYIDDNDNRFGDKVTYGLQDSAGNWIQPPESGETGPAWNWNGQGTPPIVPPGSNPKEFNPWSRPNLSYTGEGAAKIGGSVYALKVAKAKGGDLFREGQLYTGLTGGTGIRGALGYDFAAQATSWFGLNPLESYGQAKQITMQNLALGYRGNLLNQANSFGNQALQQYGVDPNTSMQMFGQMVMQAGASLEDLNDSLATLAHTASTTNTSFSQLQQNVVQYSQIGSSIGLTGGQNTAFATAAAQFAAGQPTLGATGANPADILDSMVGQALVAQQMGTSYLGLPQAISQQGAGGLLASEIKVNQSLYNRVGLNSSNYKNPDALRASYFKFQLVMNSLGMHKEANIGIKAFTQDVADTFDGKQKRMFKRTNTDIFAKDIGGQVGGSAGLAIATAIGPGPDFGNLYSTSNAITDKMQQIESQNKWKNIGIHVDGKFMSLSEIEKLPTGRRDALEAKIVTGDLPLAHVGKNGKWVQGDYATGTYLDREGQAWEQRNAYGKTPNRAAMHRSEKIAHIIELGPRASKHFQIFENMNTMSRQIDRDAKAQGLPLSDWGNPRSGNSGATGI